MSRLSKADKIAMGEISINFLGPSHTMVGKAKLVSTRNGASYGSMTVQHWSPVVLSKLEELRLVMEEELEQMFFDEGADGGVSASSPRDEGGLGEHLGDDDVAPPA